jgi:hypothetical protein
MQNPIMAMMLQTSNLTGNVSDFEAEVKPLPVQYAAVPGDKGIIASSENPIDSDFAVAEILDPAEYAEQFPDWEQRLQNSYILCGWFSLADPEGSVGWFSRVKFIPISEEQYDETLKWQEGEWPDDPPEWLNDIYTWYTDSMHARVPDRIPTTVKCPECGSNKTDLQIKKIYTASARAGVVERDGEVKYVHISGVEKDGEGQARIVCESCSHTWRIKAKEWDE